MQHSKQIDGRPATEVSAFVARLTQELLRITGSVTQRVMLFGSHASRLAFSDSDIDVLLLVEPTVHVIWRPSDNVSLRRKCDLALGRGKFPLDLWVRSTSQYADASRVCGGVEYWARQANFILYERPMRRRVGSLPDPIYTRARLTAETLDDALRLLGACVRVPSRADGLLHRSLSHAVLAVLIWHELDVLRKTDSPSVMLDYVAQANPELANALRTTLRASPLSFVEVRGALRQIASYLSGDDKLQVLTSQSSYQLEGPTRDLASLAQLKR